MEERHNFHDLAGPEEARCERIGTASSWCQALWWPVMKEEKQASHGKGDTASTVWHPRAYAILRSPVIFPGLICLAKANYQREMTDSLVWMPRRTFPIMWRSATNEGYIASPSCLTRESLTMFGQPWKRGHKSSIHRDFPAPRRLAVERVKQYSLPGSPGTELPW